jgi:monoamine oxidase
MTDGSRQVCEFDEGQYMNAGAARLPSHHQIVLGYCRELGVELEVEVNTSRSALLLNPRPMAASRSRCVTAINDTRGHVSELLAKAISKGALDQELTADDKHKMVAFLKTYGDLSPEKLLQGLERAGLKIEPGAGDERQPYDPLPMKALLDEDLWNGVLFEETIDMQATMFQPKGGMDAIPHAFAKALGPRSSSASARCARSARPNGRPKIAYRDKVAGKDPTIEADYCISTIPLPVLAKIDMPTFQPGLQEAIARTPYRDSIKIAWQAPRFWEGPSTRSMAASRS